MRDEGRFPSYHVPDDGRRYHHGQRVRVERVGGAPVVIPDPNGNYEVHDWRRETGMGGGHPLLKVELRRIGA